jgi:hypothetical protein
MDETLFWIISIIGPAILVIILIWLVFRNRNRSNDVTNLPADEIVSPVYKEDERRRREGTDDL